MTCSESLLLVERIDQLVAGERIAIQRLQQEGIESTTLLQALRTAFASRRTQDLSESLKQV